jgi:N-acyl homoserine lactone hydrolase
LRLYAFRCGGEEVDRATLDPFDAHVGTKVTIPYFFYLVQHPAGNLLFDTGAHSAFIDDPGRLGPAAEFWKIDMEPGDDVVSKVGSVGVKSEDIEHVAHSHLHYDHCGGVEHFPHARFYIQRRELAFAFHPPIYQRDVYVRWSFDHPVQWIELDGTHDVFGDGSAVLFPTPGHTPGHQSLLVRGQDRAWILCADVTYDLEKMRARALPAVVSNPDELIASWDRIEELERRHGAELIVTHDISWKERVKVAPEAWYE